MNEPKTTDIDALLKNAKISDFDKIRNNKLPDKLPTLSGFFEDYMRSYNISRDDVVNNSLMAQSYAYQILNGTKANPTRDRVIALCLAMHMNLDDVNHALRLCNNSILYSKNARDALIIIAFNNEEYDIMKLNEALTDRSMECLETSKDAGSKGNK